MDIQLEEISKISYKLDRTSRKKTVAIKIQNGKVTILSPKRLSRNRIEAVVLKRSSWILRKLKEAELAPVLKTRSYISGEKFSYLGKKYSLKVITGCPPKVSFLRKKTSEVMRMLVRGLGNTYLKTYLKHI